jgi:hypothetical protein
MACRTLRPHAVSISRAGNREQRVDALPDRPAPGSVFRPILHSLPGAAGYSLRPGQHWRQGCSRQLQPRVLYPFPYPWGDQTWERQGRCGQDEKRRGQDQKDESEKELRADRRAGRHPGDAWLPRDAWPRAAAEIPESDR